MTAHPPPSAVPPHGHAAPTPARSLRGPRILTFSGVAVLLLTLALGAVTAGLFARTLPTDVLTLRGEDGSGVLASVPVPGAQTVDLEAEDHLVYLAWPLGLDADTSGVRDALKVTGPDGTTVRVGAPGFDGRVTMGATQATTVASFTTPAAGDYTLTVDGAGLPDGARLLVVHDAGFGALFAGAMGTVLGVLAMMVVGTIGFTLVVTGMVLWYLRRRRVPYP